MNFIFTDAWMPCIVREYAGNKRDENFKYLVPADVATLIAIRSFRVLEINGDYVWLWNDTGISVSETNTLVNVRETVPVVFDLDDYRVEVSRSPSEYNRDSMCGIPESIASTDFSSLKRIVVNECDSAERRDNPVAVWRDKCKAIMVTRTRDNRATTSRSQFLRIRCPFHDDRKPSASVFLDSCGKNVHFRCFSSNCETNRDTSSSESPTERVERIWQKMYEALSRKDEQRDDRKFNFY